MDRIEKIKKYFSAPVANPLYAKFALSLLERMHPSFLDVIASYNMEGEITLRWSTSLTINLLNHVVDSDEEVAKAGTKEEAKAGDRDGFEILIHNFVPNRHWSCLDLSSSDLERVANLFEAFENSSNLEELISKLLFLAPHCD